jgi:hypothetical protein
METIDQGDKKAKFSYFGEILPNNDRSNAILAARREEEQRRKEEAERVSSYQTMSSNVLDQTEAGAGRERA